MRCVSCNNILSDYEATLKSVATGQYLDLCGSCLSDVPEIITTGNEALSKYEEVTEDE